MRFTVKDNFTASTAALIADRAERAETILAIQIQKDTEQYVPFRTGSLNQRTQVVGNTIVYPGPYARYLYYGVKMVDSVTGKGPMHYVDRHGNEVIRFRRGAVLRPTSEPLKYTTDFHKEAGPQWFERSKAQNLERWLRVAEKVANTGHE